MDLVVQLVPENIDRAFVALRDIGYRPSVPITSTQFADAVLRESWVRDKGMQVLQFWSDAHRETPVDFFVTEPFDFEAEYQRGLIKRLHGSIEVRFVSVAALIRMKEAAGRDQDKIDVQNLRMRMEDDSEA